VTGPFRDVAGKPKGPLDRAAWDDRWQRADTPWDMGRAAPPLAHALAEIPERLGLPIGSAALVPGCGAGHEARLLAHRGFRVTGVDLSSKALERARELAAAERLDVTFVEADLFALPAFPPFDLVLEHTCFCAIDPALRDRYVDAVADALRPRGRFVGLFVLFEAEQGPPFGASEAEVVQRFERRFTIDRRDVPTPHAHDARAGREGLFSMTRAR
jgi:SAM-dependent methyltransferase